MSADFKVIRLEPGQPVYIATPFFAGELRPICLWVLPHGSVKEKPSLAFELIGPGGVVFVAQISEEMLADGMRIAGEMKLLGQQ